MIQLKGKNYYYYYYFLVRISLSLYKLSKQFEIPFSRAECQDAISSKQRYPQLGNSETT